MDVAARQKIDEYIARKGLRRTVQRDVLIEATLDSTEHFTAQMLLTRARLIDRSISRATVFRTLSLLIASGALRAVNLGDDKLFYDPNYNRRPHHNHLICLDCQRIVEFEDDRMDTLENRISRQLGFTAANKIVRIEARCDELKRLGYCQKMKAATTAYALSECAATNSKKIRRRTPARCPG